MHDSIHIFITLYMAVCVHPDLCSGKHPTVAVVSGEIWEEDGGVLWHHGAYTALIFLICLCSQAAIYTNEYPLGIVPSCGQTWN